KSSDGPEGTLGVWNLRSGERLASIATGRSSGGLGWLVARGAASEAPPFGVPLALARGIAVSADGTTVGLASTPPTSSGAVIQAQAWNVATGPPIGPGCTTTSVPSTRFENNDELL